MAYGRGGAKTQQSPVYLSPWPLIVTSTFDGEQAGRVYAWLIGQDQCTDLQSVRWVCHCKNINDDGQKIRLLIDSDANNETDNQHTIADPLWRLLAAQTPSLPGGENLKRSPILQ
ncbi:hypothetical protein Enr13x_10100 [Stieleria neptunia]|uniref:Uncharacterized protein n=1 Tax=Stieleria neptunia TaxID=2527979 RepID=A0A518HK00_9BACT|nr:hypothetical protein Enr13x_10100 [Stieleria neptunia]